MIKENRTMVGSLGEEICFTTGMAIVSLVNISFFQLNWPETGLYRHSMPSQI